MLIKVETLNPKVIDFWDFIYYILLIKIIKGNYNDLLISFSIFLYKIYGLILIL